MASISSVANAVTSAVTSTSLSAAQAQATKATPVKVGQKIDKVPHFVLGADSFTRATQSRQLHAIADGVRNGTLSAPEAEALLKGQQAIATKLQTALADGKLSTQERAELRTLQASAGKQLETAAKPSVSPGSIKGIANVVGRFNPQAQHQAKQLDALATGIGNHTITTREAGALLGQQVNVADSRGDADSVKERGEVNTLLAQADKSIALHSKPGNQLDFSKVGSFIGRNVRG